MIKAELKNIAREAEDINLLEFRRSDGSALPAFSAGAHIDLCPGNGLVRSYSLVNCPSETHRYVIGVRKEPDSRGGSRFIHRQLHARDQLATGQPPENFKPFAN